MWNAWVRQRRDRDYLATPGRTAGTKANDKALIQRLLNAYVRTFSEQHYGEGMWLGFFKKRHGTIHRIFMAKDVEKAAGILRDPANTDLHYGFDETIAEYTQFIAASEPEQKRLAMLCKMNLLTLADALGVTRLENPEQYPNVPVSPSGPATDDLLTRIDKVLGLTIDFPNPWRNEFGLATARGVAGFRAIQALYQAYRIKSLVEGIQNPRILEIGGGMGRTAYYAYLMGLKNYAIVDLPFTAVSHGYFLGRTLGPEAIVPDGEQRRANAIKLLAPDTFFAESVPYDLIVNVDSLTEMPSDTAKRYWAASRRSTKRFLSINHESNEHTVREFAHAKPASRYPCWMRRGYVEELYDLTA